MERINLSPPVRIGRISYVNVDPIYYELDRSPSKYNISIVGAPPAELNAMMATNQLDISAISSVAYARHQDDWCLLPNLAVACKEDVMSVLLVGKHPLQSLHGSRVVVTDESATAAALLKLMFSVHNVTPRYKIKKIRTPSDIGLNTAAALVIGDAALRYSWHNFYEYTWDLGDLWAAHAGLPFVFAVWAVRKAFAADHPEKVSAIVDAFLESKAIGLKNLEKVIHDASEKLGISRSRSARYFNNFCYTLDPPQLAGLQAFYDDLYKHKLLHRRVSVQFFASPSVA